MKIFFLLAAVQLFAAEVLDIDMTKEEKKKTGIIKLTAQEKAALQQWIDLHYQKRIEVPENKKITGKHPILEQNLLNGKYVRLSDGSLWNIRPEDIPVVQGWIAAAEIAISQSTNPFFPFKLTNMISGSSVLARKVDKLPESTEAPPSKEKKAEK